MASEPAHNATHAHEFDLDAGVLALDFANTLDGRYDPIPNEKLGTYQDLLDFGVLTGAIDRTAADRLAAAAIGTPDPAERQLHQARKLREAIFNIFSAVAADRDADAGDLGVLNAFHQRAMSRGKVIQSGDAFTWTWDDDGTLDRPLWPVVKSAVDLLLTGDQRRMRECAAHDCGWLFYDTSRNQSRRWCSMQSCGNRAKVQQFRERQRKA